MSKIYRTDFLFTNSNMFSGLGSIINIGGNYFEFNYSSSSEEADAKAIENDWGVIGQDLKEITLKYSEKDIEKLCLTK